MGSMIARSLRKQEIPQWANRVNTPMRLAARAPPSALGAPSLAFARGRWPRGLGARGRFHEVRRQLGVGLNDPDQYLVILGTAALGFKPPPQRQGVFGAQIDL